METRDVKMVKVYVEKIENQWFGVAFEDESIEATSFGTSEKGVLSALRKSISSDTIFEPLENEFAHRVLTVLKNVYEGKEVCQNIAFNMERFSDYRRKVTETACLIPQGYVASYGGVAKAAGGRGARAVGHVMASNPFAPLCPCHRVVAADLTLGGYGGGLDEKLAFLKREKRGYSSKKIVKTTNGNLELIPVEFVLRKLSKGKR